MNNDYISGYDPAFDYEAANRQITIDNIVNDTDKPLLDPNVVYITKYYKEASIDSSYIDYNKLISLLDR